MTDSAILAWCLRHHALVHFGPYTFTVWVSGYEYQTGATLEEAIEAMRNHMTVVDATMFGAPEQMLLLGQGSES